MTEQEAIELLGKLNKFMTDTTNQITTLINRTHNLQVDVDNLKKNIINQNQNRIIVTN